MDISPLTQAVEEIWKDGIYKEVCLGSRGRTLAVVYLERNQDTFTGNDPDEKPVVADILTIKTRSAKLCEDVLDQYSGYAYSEWTTDDRGLHSVSFLYDKYVPGCYGGLYD